MPRKEPRDYQAENKQYHSKPEVKHRRALRNKDRREAIREGRAHKGDGTAVDHIIPLTKGGSNRKSNLRVISAHSNRVKGNKMPKK
jgi:5-methylcytosine-specific restriction endonuclease McrA